MPVTLNVQGLKIARRHMASLLKEVKSSPNSMRKIGLLGVRDVTDHFNRSQGPKNNWLPLKHRNGKPLLDTGMLRARTRFKVQGNNVLLFNNTKYGKYHQYGASKIFLPQRKWMWISAVAQTRMTQVYLKILMESYK